MGFIRGRLLSKLCVLCHMWSVTLNASEKTSRLSINNYVNSKFRKKTQCVNVENHNILDQFIKLVIMWDGSYKFKFIFVTKINTVTGSW